MSNPNVMRYTALGLAGTATVLLILCQFLPIESGKESFFGDVSFDSNLWNAKAEANGGSQTEGWFEDCDGGSDCDGIGLLRAGIIIFTIGLVAAAAAAILLAFGPARVGSVAAFAATVIVLLGFLFWTIGYGQLADGDMSDLTDPAVAFYFAILSMVLLAAAGVLGLLAGGAPRARAARGQVNF